MDDDDVEEDDDVVDEDDVEDDDNVVDEDDCEDDHEQDLCVSIPLSRLVKIFLFCIYYGDDNVFSVKVKLL